MSINGIKNPILSTLNTISRPGETGKPGADKIGYGTQQKQVANNSAPAQLRPQQPITGNAATQHAVPAEAPPGTDEALWSVLTSEERAFFAKTAALGPLTYGRIKAAAAPAPAAPRGVRLDVRA